MMAMRLTEPSFQGFFSEGMAFWKNFQEKGKSKKRGLSCCLTDFFRLF
jgi:hypothetical protein